MLISYQHAYSINGLYSPLTITKGTTLNIYLLSKRHLSKEQQKPVSDKTGWKSKHCAMLQTRNKWKKARINTSAHEGV